MASQALAHKAVHGTATISRDLAHPPARVFAAFAEPGRRDSWFRMPGQNRRELDFRVGGSESADAVTEVSGAVERLEWRSHIFDVAADRRIVFAYEIVVNGERRYVSLVTVELTAEDGARASTTPSSSRSWSSPTPTAPRTPPTSEAACRS
ncbi:hypothetical protein GCM10029992_61520 [Glycomyces albus]